MVNLVTFAKKLWKDKVGGNTPITAAELNRMEDGINNCATQINKLGDSVCQRYSVVDLNEAKQFGCFVYRKDETKNNPIENDAYGVVLVVCDRTFTSQIAINNYDVDGHRVWVRSNDGSGWSPWKTIV